METQLHDHHHHQKDGLPSVMEGECEVGHEHHGEKKSVLKKVKDKAKKIKNTIKKHGHGHGHDDDDDEDGDDHVLNHPQSHGPPMYESSVVKSRDIAKDDMTNLENRRYKREDRYDDAPQKKTSVGPMGCNSPADFPSPPAHLAPEFNNQSVDEKRAYTAKTEPNPVENKELNSKPISVSASEYAHKVGGGGDAGKGVSMKEYLSEKLRPGDEDRELCKVITNALEKKKRERGKEEAMGKVTMSEEVAARLGDATETKREGKDAVESGQQSSGQGVVDRLRDAVGLWLGKSNGIQTAQDSIAKSFVSEAGRGS